MQTTTRIEGMQQALRQFRRAPAVARKYIGDAVRVTEGATAAQVRANAPVASGALRQSVTSKTVGLTASISFEEGEFYGGQRPSTYWRFVEFGARGKAANPFIRTAAEAQSEPFVQRVKDAGARMERDLQI
jgi:HK97 gp10 family phage protein